MRGLAAEVYGRIKASLVDVHVPRVGGGELHTLGVVVERGGVTAWSGVDAAGGTWENLEAITIKQGPRAWRAQMHSLRVEWALCVLAVQGEFPVPAVRWRRSNTLAMVDRMLYARRKASPEAP